MKTHKSERIAMAISVACLIVISISIATAADNPSPTPTTHPRRLGDIKLKTRTTADDTEGVVISDTNIAELAGRGTVSVGGTFGTESRHVRPQRTPLRTDRTRWRKAVLDQKRVIVELERKKLHIEAQIDLIEDGSLSIRALARIQRAEIELRAIERKIQSEKNELARLIREARRHGAEPGWFR